MEADNCATCLFEWQPQTHNVGMVMHFPLSGWVDLPDLEESEADEGGDAGSDASLFDDRFDGFVLPTSLTTQPHNMRDSQIHSTSMACSAKMPRHL